MSNLDVVKLTRGRSLHVYKKRDRWHWRMMSVGTCICQSRRGGYATKVSAKSSLYSVRAALINGMGDL